MNLVCLLIHGSVPVAPRALANETSHLALARLGGRHAYEESDPLKAD